MSDGSGRAALPRAGVLETLRFLAAVGAPLVAKGVIIRRPRAVALAAMLDLDGRSVRFVEGMRRRHGPGPVILRLGFRDQAVILSPKHVVRVLEGTPEPFAADPSEKRSALRQFEPHAVLISPAAERTERRAVNEAALDTACPVHRLGERFTVVVGEEAAPLLRAPVLDWDAFATAWWRSVRRIVLGDAARDDAAMTDVLARLRRRANWAFAVPVARRLRAEFTTRLEAHLSRAEPGSLAAVLAVTPAGPGAEPAGQVPQWLFAFDAAAIATFRALAMLAVHPHARERASAEVEAPLPRRPYLRACLLDTLRLWPTTPAILRQTTRETIWDGAPMAAGTGVLILAPYFHRDRDRLAQADRFVPEAWLNAEPPDPAFVPFSAGPAGCPGRNVVLLVGSAMLAALLPRVSGVEGTRLSEGRPLPGQLDPFALRFRVTG